MPRIYLPSDQFALLSPDSRSSDVVCIGAEAAYRVSRVLRLREGDHLYVTDGRGNEHKCVVESLGKREVTIRRICSRQLVCRPRRQLRILQAIPKGQKLDGIIQKCAELGVSELVPVFTQRTIPRLDAQERRHKVARWQKISQHATEQCGRPDVMQIHSVLLLREALLHARRSDRKWILYEGEATPLREVLAANGSLEDLQGERSSSVPTLSILIGPEGGFTDEEVQQAREEGFFPVSLGPRILRTETVAPLVSGILLYVSGDL